MRGKQKPIVVIGMGDDGPAGLGPEARAALAKAEVLIGGARHVALVAKPEAEQITWKVPLAETFAEISARSGKVCAVIASGDPLCFGVASTLIEHFGASRVKVIPHLSAFSLALARLGWTGQAVKLLSLCGRPLAPVRRELARGRKLILYAADRSSALALAELLVEEGFGGSEMHILAHLGGKDEQSLTRTAETIARAGVDPLPLDLITLAVECKADTPERGLSTVPGLDDALFEHDGQLTKYEARALALAALRPRYGETLLDLGAGAGSVSIEWLRSTEAAEAIATERDGERALRIARNAEKLGVPHLCVRECDNLEALDAVSKVDAIFIGGGLSQDLLQRCLAQMMPGQRLAAHAVTLASEAILLEAFSEHGGRLTRHQITRAEKLGTTYGWRPAMPLTQWVYVK